MLKVILPGNRPIPSCTVITIRLCFEYRELPLPKEFEHRRVLHNVMFVVFMMVGLMCLAFIQPPPHNAGGKIAAGLMAFNATFFSALICIVAPLFAWILYGLHIKRHGWFQLSFFKEARERLGRDFRPWFPPRGLLFAYGLMGFILYRPRVPVPAAELL